MKTRTLALLALTPIALLAMASPAAAHNGGHGNGNGHGHHHTVTMLKTQLRGTNEALPNALGGHGKATIMIHATKVCFELKVKTTTAAAFAHIHQAAVGVDGPDVLTLAPINAQGKSKGCIVGVDATLIANLSAHPEQFYVNVHTAALPGGDIRGQLRLHDRRKH